MAYDRDLREFLQKAGIFPGLPLSTLPGWPANAAGVLTNDGNGILSWGAGGGGGSSIGGLVAGGTAGSVLFLGAGSILAQDNANLFFDDTTNQLSVSAGTDLAPGLVFNKDYGSGLYASGAGNIAISVAGVKTLEARAEGVLFPGLFGDGYFDSITNEFVVGVFAEYPLTGTHYGVGYIYNLDSLGNVMSLSIFGAPLDFQSDGTSDITFASANSLLVQTTNGISITATGSAAAPSLSINGAHGLFYTGANDLGVSAGGVEIMRFNSDGSLDLAPSAAAVSGAGRGTFRYDTATNKLQFSNNGGAWADVGSGGAMVIGGAITSATAGSVLFAGVGGVLQQDNANFFWNDTQNRLGLNTNAPGAPLDLRVNGTALLPAFILGATLDVDTGFWKPAVDTIGVSAGGVEKLRITSNPGSAQGIVTVIADGITSQHHGFAVFGDLPTGTSGFEIGSRAQFYTTNAVAAVSYYGSRTDLLGGIGYVQGTQRYAAVAGFSTNSSSAPYNATTWGFQYGNMGGYFETAITEPSAVSIGSASRSQIQNSSLSIGHYAKALANNGYAIGVVGLAHTNSAANLIGGFFTNHFDSIVPTFVPGALIADSNVVGAPIFRGRNNNTDRFFIYETGITRVAIDGSAATPALYFGSIDDPDTGAFHPSANVLAWSTAGTERLRLTSTGEVGIGDAITPSSNEMLRVQRNGNIGISQNIVNSTSGTLGLAAQVITANTSTLSLYAFSPGYTGVTAFQPSSSLVRSSGDLWVDSAGAAVKLATNDIERLRVVQGGEVSIGTGIAPSTNEMLRIERNGNFSTFGSINNTTSGTTAAAAITVQNASIALSLVSYGAGYTGSGVSQPSSSLIRTGGSLYVGSAAALPIIFFTADTERARIANSGTFTVGSNYSVESTGRITQGLRTANFFSQSLIPSSGGDGYLGLMVSSTPSDRPVNYIGKGRGTVNALTNVQSGDILGDHGFVGGVTGNGLGVGAVIRGTAAENWSGTGYGTKMEFMTMRNGSVVPLANAVMTLTQDQRVGINVAAPGSTLDVDNKTTSESILILRDNGTAVMTVADGGDVGIGVTPTEKLSLKDHTAFDGSETQVTTGAAQTTDATQTNLVIISLSDNSVYWFEADVVGRRTDVVGDRVHYKYTGLCYREGGGSVIEAQTNLVAHESGGATAFDSQFTASGNAIRVTVIGEAAKTVNWTTTLRYQRVSGNT